MFNALHSHFKFTLPFIWIIKLERSSFSRIALLSNNPINSSYFYDEIQTLLQNSIGAQSLEFDVDLTTIASLLQRIRRRIDDISIPTEEKDPTQDIWHTYRESVHVSPN